MSNTDQHRKLHEAVNRRDWDTLGSLFAGDCEFADVPRGLTLKGPGQFVDYIRSGWVGAFSDGMGTNPRYLDAGKVSIARFSAKGTNDRPLGPLPPTGRTAVLPMCEILTFDDDGKIIDGELYYDLASLLTQLGHIPPPEG
jgi:hypothetical protein